MLEQLNIRNFILIDELTISFAAGLNVLSGETGAGKSIIIDAIELLCGERGRGGYVRNLEKSAWIEAVFSCPEYPALDDWLKGQGWDADDELLVLSREIRKDGRSVARLNGRIISLGLLREAASYLLDLHGQNDRQKLLDPRQYLSYIDSFLQEDKLLLNQTAAAYAQYHSLMKEKEQLMLDEQERLQQLDFLNFQIEEIEKMQLEAGEEEELTRQRDRMQNTESLKKSCQKIADLLFYGEQTAADVNIYRAMETAKHQTEDPFFQQMASQLETIYYELQEQKYQLSDFQGELDSEPGLLEEIEERLYQIRKLEKKYGATIPDILGNHEKMCVKREQLENITHHAEKLEQEIARSYEAYRTVAFALREKRLQAKTILETGVRQELQELNLPNLRFEIQLTEKETPGRNGLDEAEFLFSANPGEPLRPLQKIASGGELSRFTLALKIALAERYPTETIILDEIDVGLGGMAQRSMAVKLWKFSRSRQLLLVTHAAQIAAFSESHFRIQKEVREDKTYTFVQKLDEKQRIQELARMLDGDEYSEISLNHAEQLLQEADKYAE